MAVTQSTTCDNCDAVAPQGSSYIFPKEGWLGLGTGFGGRDFCSVSCVAAWATRTAARRGEVVIVDRAEVDELEGDWTAIMSTQGSIKKDASGKWSFVVDLASAGGKRKQAFRRGFATKKEAQAELTTLLGNQQRGTYVAPTRSALGQFLLDEWLPARRPSLRASTAASYEQMIRNYVAPTLGAAKLRAVDGAALNAFYGRLLREGRTETRRGLGAGLSPKTVRNVHGLLSRAFRDAVSWGRMHRNPCDAADPPRGGVTRDEGLDGRRTSPVRRLDEHSPVGWRVGTHRHDRDAQRRGARPSLVGCGPGGRSGHDRSTRVRFGKTIATSTPKTARGNRTVALGPAVSAGLRTWRRQQAADQLLMGAGWRNGEGLVVTVADRSAPNPEAFSNLFGKLVRTAGLPIIRLHDVRHSYATAALASGVPVKVVSQRIGHADVGVTLKIYAHVMPGDDIDAAVLADALLG